MQLTAAFIRGSEMKKKVIPLISAFLIITACAAVSVKTGIDVPAVNIMGAYVSVLLITAVTWKFPFSFFICAIIFDVFATAGGSVLNLYRTIGCYDKIIHFLSGVLAAAFGKAVIEFILKRKGAPQLKEVILLFTLFFSFACAGLWEVYEFSMDHIIGTHMQGDSFDTMTDIISGILGGLTYCAFIAAAKKRPASRP